MFNLHDKIKAGPEFYRQLRCGDALVTLFHCLLENRYEDTWSQHNYIVYVVEGRKIWHTPNGSYDLNKGDCVFVRKGAAIVEQFFETTSCFILFSYRMSLSVKHYAISRCPAMDWQRHRLLRFIRTVLPKVFFSR